MPLSLAYAAGGNFRFATKVTKGAPKKGKTTVRSGFLPFLWNLSHLSTGRGSPPRINARGLKESITQHDPRAVGAVEIETSTSREPVFAFDAVRFLAADVRLHICEKTVPWTCHRALPGVDLLPAARRTGAARRGYSSTRCVAGVARRGKNVCAENAGDIWKLSE